MCRKTLCVCLLALCLLLCGCGAQETMPPVVIGGNEYASDQTAEITAVISEE